jgi:hypothetical protein
MKSLKFYRLVETDMAPKSYVRAAPERILLHRAVERVILV